MLKINKYPRLNISYSPVLFHTGSEHRVPEGHTREPQSKQTFDCFKLKILDKCDPKFWDRMDYTCNARVSSAVYTMGKN